MQLSERFVIGSVLLRGSDCFNAIPLRAQDFELDNHRRIWERMSEIAARGDAIDYGTVFGELQRNGDHGVTLGFLVDLGDGIPNLANLDSYVRDVREKSALRRLAAACQSGLNRALAGEEDAASVIASQISALQEIETTSEEVWESPVDIISRFGSRQQFLSPAAGQKTGIPFPWPTIQALTGGMQNGELVVVAGRPSMGKSVIAQQISMHAAARGCGVGYVSLEMSNAAVLRRGVVQASHVDASRMKLGYLNTEERAAVTDACRELEHMPLRFNDRLSSGRTAQAILASLRQLKAREGIGLAVIDHMHLVDGPEREERQKYMRIIDQFQRGAKDLDIPLIVLAQLNRKCEDDKREPGMSDLSETGKIEQNADLVMFIHRPEMYACNRDKQELRGMAKMIIGKQRDGQVGACDMTFLKNQTRFEECAAGSWA